MANTANWLFLMLFYFVGISIVMGCLSVSGILTSDIDIETNPDVEKWEEVSPVLPYINEWIDYMLINQVVGYIATKSLLWVDKYYYNQVQ